VVSFAILVLLAPSLGLSQLNLVESQSGLNAASGTLVIVLANKRGFVIASDSRRTDNDGYEQVSQKLFRLGPHTALGIAGFASIENGPFKTELAGEIYKARSKYTDAAGISWINESVLPKLELLRKIAQWASDGRPATIDVSAILARFDPHGRPVVSKWPRADDAAPGAGDSFQWAAVGITILADSIMAGHYSGTDAHIRAFVRTKLNGSCDSMSLNQLANAAKAIIREAGREEPKIGGALQMGIFENGKTPIWIQPEFPLVRPVLQTIPTNEGSVFEDASNGGRPIYQAMPQGRMIESGVPGELARASVGALILNSRVVADGNVFVHDTFYNSVIEIVSSPPLYFINNLCQDSFLLKTSSRTLIPLNVHCVPFDSK
jgi:hypothetical protein